MPAVLVFCEADDKGLRTASLPALTAGAALAKQTGGDLVAVVIGKGVGAAAADAAKHAKRVLVYDDAKLEAPLAETWAPQLADAVKRAGASALLGTASSTGKDILPRAAALLGAGMASDVTAILGANRFKRPAYAGNAIEEVEVGGSVVVASVRQTAFPPSAAGAAPARSRTSRSARSMLWARSSWRCTQRRRARDRTSVKRRWSCRVGAACARARTSRCSRS
jgi:electron transfer flavoprotein alpha subunit